MPEKPYEMRTVEASFEVRESAGAPVFEGYAATFNQEYDLGPFVERIAPQAFDKTLAGAPDVRLLVDHEGQPLARTKSGTLQLSTDTQGLHARATLDPTDPDVQRLLPKMRRGDLDQMSFAFRVPTGGDSWSPDYTQRTITEAALSGGDVSVVTYPANPSTSASVRARDQREAMCVFAETMVRELRAGKAISAANMTKLASVLAALHTADDNLDQIDSALDEAQATIADVIGKPDPDDDDSDVQTNGLPLDLARRIATATLLRKSA